MKIILETTLKELEAHGLVVCVCGHPPNNHFYQFEKESPPCAHCDCLGYKPKILLGKRVKLPKNT